MANVLLPLTDSLYGKARPEVAEYALRDTRQPGFALRVQPCGSRTWIVRVRLGGKPSRRLLGTFPETSVKSARQIAAALLAAEAEGLRTYRAYVRCELLPAFAGKRLDAITRQDVVRWFERYSARRPGGANRALGVLGHMLGRAKAWGRLPDGWRNPVTGIRMNRRRPVGTFLSKDQMARLGAVLDARIAEGCTAPRFCASSR